MVFYAHSRWQVQMIQRMGACSHGAGTSGALAQGRGVGIETLHCLCFLLMTLVMYLLILCVFICSLHHFYFSWLSFCPWTYEMSRFGCCSLWRSLYVYWFQFQNLLQMSELKTLRQLVWQCLVLLITFRHLCGDLYLGYVAYIHRL